MTKIADIFNNPAFGTAEMTEAINVIPTQYGLLNELGLFKEKGITTTTVQVEKKNGVLNVLSAVPADAPGVVNTSGKRELVSLSVPHFIVNDRINAADIQNIRKFGSSDELEAVQDVVNDKLAEMKAKHEITLEFLRAGALQGQIKDGDGTTLVNLFTEFGVTQHTQNFATGTASTNIPKILRDVKRYIEQNLKGETMSGILCLCSANWFEALIGHSSIKDAYNAYQGSTPYRDDLRYTFEFNGIRFIEYEGSTTNAAGSTLRFVPDNEAIFLPLGTRNVFETVYAPADYVEAVNTIGLPYYAKQELADMGRGVNVQTQSHPLPICKRPDLLVKATKS